MVKSLKQSKNKGLTLKNKLKLSLNNFMERKWRNLLIATATSIGFIGVLISFGLGNAIVGMINDSTDGGNIPSQIQISLSAKSAARGVLNADDEKFIRSQIKSDDIKYLESPFGMNMASLTLDGKTIDFSGPSNYSQVISLYKNTKISTSRNDKDKISAGKPFKSEDEKGLTLPMSFVKRYNQEIGKKLKAKDFIGKEISAQIVENTAEGTKVADIKTKIVRIVDDSEDAEEGNSYMPAKQLEELLKENGFTKTVSYMLLELKDPAKTKEVTKKLQKNKKYLVLSQQAILDVIIKFIRVIQALLITLSSQAILVSAVMIGIIIYINIMQRSKEIGVMKAVGYLNRDVKAIFVYEALWITGISLALALLVSQGIGSLANMIVSHLYPSVSKVFDLNLTSILIMFGFSLLMGYLSAYLPARKISKMDPVESLRYE
ncbi:MAG: ABC transporter permease [Streptococcus salivarius]